MASGYEHRCLLVHNLPLEPIDILPKGEKAFFVLGGKAVRSNTDQPGGRDLRWGAVLASGIALDNIDPDISTGAGIGLAFSFW